MQAGSIAISALATSCCPCRKMVYLTLPPNFPTSSTLSDSAVDKVKLTRFAW